MLAAAEAIAQLAAINRDPSLAQWPSGQYQLLESRERELVRAGAELVLFGQEKNQQLTGELAAERAARARLQEDLRLVGQERDRFSRACFRGRQKFEAFKQEMLDASLQDMRDSVRQREEDRRDAQLQHTRVLQGSRAVLQEANRSRQYAEWQEARVLLLHREFLYDGGGGLGITWGPYEDGGPPFAMPQNGFQGRPWGGLCALAIAAQPPPGSIWGPHDAVFWEIVERWAGQGDAAGEEMRRLMHGEAYQSLQPLGPRWSIAPPGIDRNVREEIDRHVARWSERFVQGERRRYQQRAQQLLQAHVEGLEPSDASGEA